MYTPFFISMCKPSPSSKYLKLIKVTKTPNVLHIYDILINIFPFSELFSSIIVGDFFFLPLLRKPWKLGKDRPSLCC